MLAYGIPSPATKSHTVGVVIRVALKSLVWSYCVSLFLCLIIDLRLKPPFPRLDHTLGQPDQCFVQHFGRWTHETS